MKRPIIAIDIDEVLLPHFEGLIAWYNREYGTDLTLAHNHPSDPRPWGTDNISEAIKRVQRYFQTESFRNEEPFREAIEALRTLGDDYELIVITARDEIIEQATRDWLAKHFDQVFREAHFTAHYSLTGKNRSKVDVAKEAGAAYFIDDSLTTVLEVANAGIESILFGSYPWNQSKELPANVTRCHDWLAVQEYFNARG